MKGLVFTYLLTAGGAVTGLFSPFVGLLVYICFAIIRPEAMWAWSVPKGNYSRIVALGLLFGWAINGFGRWNLGRGTAIVVALLGYWLWTTISVVQAADPVKAWAFVIFLAKVVLPFLVGITTIDSLQKLRLLAWVIVGSLGYLALELNLAFISGFNRVWLDGFGGLDNNGVAIEMVTGIGLAFFLGLGAPTLWRKGLAFFAAALMAHVIMFSFSRGGMLALCITGLVAFLMIPKRAEHYLAFALAIVLGVVMAGKEVRERFWSTFASAEQREASAQSRVVLWGQAIDATLREPLLGWGPDQWGDLSLQYGWAKPREVHSLWLQTSAEIGIPGLLFLLAFYGITVVRLWPLARGKAPVEDPWVRDAARMVIAAMTGFGISAQFVSLKELEVPFYVTLIGAGLLALNTHWQARRNGPVVWYYRPTVPRRARAQSAGARTDEGMGS
jgi:O-antigen ligase